MLSSSLQLYESRENYRKNRKKQSVGAEAYYRLSLIGFWLGVFSVQWTNPDNLKYQRVYTVFASTGVGCPQTGPDKI
jgi:hypothetical protein